MLEAEFLPCSQSWYIKTTMMCSVSCLVQSPPCESGKRCGKDCVCADKDREERKDRGTFKTEESADCVLLHEGSTTSFSSP